MTRVVGRYALMPILSSLVLAASCQTPAPIGGMMTAHWTSLEGQSLEVPFRFESMSNEHGVLFTTLGPGGEHFSGPYVLAESSTQGKLVTEVWNGMSSPEWAVWDQDAQGNWHAEATSFGAFAHFYSGKAVASMKGSLGDSMRCQLHLLEPAKGPLAGGTGECQTTLRDHIALSFTPE